MSTVIRTIEIGESIAAWPRVTIEDKAKLVTDLAKGIEPNKGPYVISCDTDAWEGRGAVVFTHDITKAKRFENISEALEYWRRQSRVVPLRPDGKPNRPLTAYHVTFETAP